MNRLRWIFGVVALCALAVVLSARGNASFLQTQQDQIAVYILVNVTPAPVVYAPPQREPSHIAVRMRLRARGSNDFVDAVNLHLGNLVAQQQSAVRVQAEVSPNPKATLLYSNQPAVSISQTAGTTKTYSCSYTVTVSTTQSSWTLYDGLSNDFVTGSWPGADLSHNTYLQGGAPNPAPTAFVVYPDNNSQWAVLSKSGLTHTYCVDLVLTIPSNIGQGAYTTNAIYTLYY